MKRVVNLVDISESISIQQQELQLIPNGHPYFAVALALLGTWFLCRFERTGDPSDISQAISTQQRAVQLIPNGHPGMPSQLSNLGHSFVSRFQHMGGLSDLSEAISLHQRAIQLGPIGHSDMPKWLNSLGTSFLHRFEHMGDSSDLSKAISAQKRAIQLTPDGNPHMPLLLNNLGASLLLQFKRTGNPSDVLEGIANQHRAIQLTPKGHPNMPAWLNNLAASFLSRFERMGYRDSDLSELSEAILALRQAVQLTPNDQLGISAPLNNLGLSLQFRFERMGDPSDRLEAISVLKRAVQLTPNGNPNMPSMLSNLGNSILRSRFELMEDLSNLSEAIPIQRRAVQLTSNHHPNMPAYMNNLANSLRTRFIRTRDLSDIMEAISIMQHSMQLIPDGHPGMHLLLKNLGNAFLSRFNYTRDLFDAYTAMAQYRTSATTLGHPSGRLTAAQKWAEFTEILNHPTAIEAYATAIDLITQIASMERTVEQRHTDLVSISSLTTAAASAAFARNEIEKALEWLEQGRCLVWGQLNQLRTPVDDLRAHDARLAEHFLNISSALESSGSRPGLGSLSVDAPISEKISLQEEAHMHIKLSGEWNQLLEEIRDIPRFRKFLQPPQASELLKLVPPDGPIILINVTKCRCDAIALIYGCNEPIHIHLKEFTYERASELSRRLGNFLSWNGVRMREEHRAVRPAPDRRVNSDIHFVLGVLWLEVVRPILDSLAYTVSFISTIIFTVILMHFPPKATASLDPGRIWWCPTGPLAFLPLHAAGIYSQKREELSPPGSCISDFVVSSYTPTVSALLRISDGSTTNLRPTTQSRLLIISQPNTPGCSPIKGTTKEMDAIRRIMETKYCKSLCLEGEVATVNRVQLEMASHPSIHFACHASQDIENPLRSGFHLHDGRLELAEVMKQRITDCELAFLSACQTSTGDEKLCEEAVHLAAGMLAVGYRSVVATMWSIKDEYGPVVAESFYNYLMENKTPSGRPGIDSVNAAHALLHAIQDIRKQVGHTEQGLLTWVPYVHFGH